MSSPPGANDGYSHVKAAGVDQSEFGIRKDQEEEEKLEGSEPNILRHGARSCFIVRNLTEDPAAVVLLEKG